MNVIIRGGVLLGVLVTIFSWGFAFSGMHKAATAATTFIGVATLIEVVVLIWALKKTAAQGRRYLGQVSAGTMLAFVGGCLIFATSWMLVTQLYPAYFSELASEEARATTPLANSVSGFLGTVITGLVVSAIAAIWIRSKEPKSAAA